MAPRQGLQPALMDAPPPPPQPHRFTPDNVPRGIRFELAPPKPALTAQPGGPAPTWRRWLLHLTGVTGSHVGPQGPQLPSGAVRGPHAVLGAARPCGPPGAGFPTWCHTAAVLGTCPSPAVPRGDRCAHVFVVVLLQHPHVWPFPAARVLQPTPRSGGTSHPAVTLPRRESRRGGWRPLPVYSGSGSRFVCLLMRLVSSLSFDHTDPCDLSGVAWACRAHMCFVLILGNRLHQCHLEM